MSQVSRKVLFSFLSTLFLASNVVFAQEVEVFEEDAEIDSSVVMEQDDSGTSFSPIIKQPIDPVEAFQPVYAQKETDELTGDEYVINRGDCLWDLSARFYNTPWRWREIWNANAYIQNPNLIYPHDKLVIPGFMGSAPSADRRREDLDSYGEKKEVGLPAEESAEVEYDEEVWQDEVIPAEFSGIVASPGKGKYLSLIHI